ncbi:MAG: S9 family peptidase [Mesorhizobium sp.]|nr:MAG: S9 family peptidase [Mesorhizobium sp.]TJW50094.1 MAG: S9 family peptidase [Mesorhizobium sp.]
MQNVSYSPDNATMPAVSGDRLFWIDTRGGLRPSLWCANRDGMDAKRLFGDKDAVTSFRAFANGTKVVVATDCGGDEHHQLRVISLDGAPTRHLTSDAFVINLLGTISADGRRLAFASNRQDRSWMGISITDLETGERRDHALSQGEWTVDAWTKDDEKLYVSNHRGAGDIVLYLLDPASGELNAIAPLGPARFAEIHPTEDGVLLRTDWGNDNIYVAHLRSDGSLRAILRTGHDIDTYLPLGDGRIAALVNVELGHEIRIGSPETGWEVLDLPVRVRKSLSLNSAGRLMWCEQWANMPARIVTWDLAASRLDVLVQPHAELLPGIASVEPFRATAPDGREVPAIIYRPENPNGAGVFNIHGGPEGQWMPNCEAYVAEMCRRGWTVIAPNVRGSIGFGRNWLLLDNVTLRRDVIADIAALYDAAICKEKLDPSRMAVMGDSYGGFMTALQLAYERDRWSIAAIIFGFADVQRVVDSFGSWRRSHRMWEYGNNADPLVLRFQQDLSPLRFLSQVKVPVFLYHALRDPRVPIEQSDLIEAELHRGGAPVSRVTVEDEGHGYVNRETRNRLWTAIVAHFAAVLEVIPSRHPDHSPSGPGGIPPNRRHH